MQPDLVFTVYPGRANSVKLTLTDDEKSIDHSAVSRLAVSVGGQLFDSQTQPELFNLNNSRYFEIKLAAAGLSPGRYPATLILYDTGSYLNGFVWPVGFVVVVKAL